jgi:cardiolipin synthase
LSARSLRRNFELDLECYSTDLAARPNGLFRDRLRDAVPMTLDSIDAA